MQYYNENIALSLLPLFLILTTALPLIQGYCTTRGKDQIVYRLEKGDIGSIRDAQRYNNRLAEIDNYFYRFTPVDPDDYIDIEACYKEASKCK